MKVKQTKKTSKKGTKSSKKSRKAKKEDISDKVEYPTGNSQVSAKNEDSFIFADGKDDFLGEIIPQYDPVEPEPLPMITTIPKRRAINKGIKTKLTLPKSSKMFKPNHMTTFIRNFVKYIGSSEEVKNKFFKIPKIVQSTDKDNQLKKFRYRVQKFLERDEKLNTQDDLRDYLVYAQQDMQHLTKFMLEICGQYLTKFKEHVKDNNLSQDNLKITDFILNFRTDIQKQLFGQDAIVENQAVINIEDYLNHYD